MSKKILKRSLALGALMAFVITGSVWANDPVWSGEEELNSDVASGKVVANIEDQQGIAGNNVAYLVTGDNESVNANIEVNAKYRPDVTPKGKVAAVLLNGNDGADIKKTMIKGDIDYNVTGSSNGVNQGVYLYQNADYRQEGDLNINIKDTDNVDCNIIAFRVGASSDDANNVVANLDGDINVYLENSTADVVNIVRVTNGSEMIHNGNINFYAKNFAGTEADHEGISGLWCRNGGVATLNGDINMTFINNGETDQKYLNVNNIYGAGFHFDGTINHNGNISINFGGKASDLFEPESKWFYGDNNHNQGTIYAYINHVGSYNVAENNINTIKFGVFGDEENVPFTSSATDPFKWSFAHFDVMQVMEGSSFYIDDTQRTGYYLCKWYFGSPIEDNLYNVNEGQIHSDGGVLYLGSNELILEKNASATMNRLEANDAKITIGEGAKLIVKGNLEGNATFALANLEENQVIVTGAATGDNYIAEISMDNLQEGANVGDVAKDNNGSIIDAVVGISDAVYESGTADIDENGNLTNVEKVVDSANVSINDMVAIGLMSWRAEMNDMNKRMGELRNANGEHGVWVRMVRGESEYNSVKNQYNQYQLGYDEKLSVDKRWTVGAAISYTDAENSFAEGTGESTNKAFSVYGSKLNEDGTFVDLIAKYARLDNDFKTLQGQGAAEYDTNAYSFSAEVGKRIQQGKGLWIEPQVELTYGKVSAVDYVTDKGVNVAQYGMESIVGRIGFSLGKDIEKGNVYARASYLYDFDGETKAVLDGVEPLGNDLGGGWWEVGVGANINLSKATYIYADVEKTFGGEVDTNWQWNLGVRYSF